VRVVVSEPATDLIGERGGRLYVWLVRSHCCGATTRLATASAPPRDKEFRRVDADTTFELYVPEGLARLPDELHVEAKRHRIQAYWNGCAWVV
jgi:hypothetical protein